MPNATNININITIKKLKTLQSKNHNILHYPYSILTKQNFAKARTDITKTKIGNLIINLLMVSATPCVLENSIKERKKPTIKRIAVRPKINHKI